jgi:Xaa-Pro aminopeptidase
MPNQSTPNSNADAALLARLRSESPMNLARAYEVMERFGLDGLVVAEPVNVFHVLGYWPQIANTKVGAPPTTFALLARDPRQAPGLVTSRFIYYYTYADGGFTRDVQVHLFRDAVDTGPIEPAAPAPAGPLEFPDRQLAPLTPVEQRRLAALDAAVAAHGSHADAGAAIVRAMREMGLWHGRVAVDHPLIEAVCARHGRPGTLVPGDEVLRWIRIVKSPLEIDLMRRASAANVAAVAAVGRAIRAGATYAELRQAYEIEAARRGNRAVFLTVDRVSSELSDEQVADGQAFFIDGVSHWRHYHGDFARTVFVGEPRPEAQRAGRAVGQAWDAVRERLRPGLRYSEIVAIGREAVRKHGSGLTIGFGPHSVGLAHTDEPGEDAGGFHRKLDLALEPGMILSVDCPVMNTGVGGSAHIEDLMLITADGAEPIHELAAPVIVV